MSYRPRLFLVFGFLFLLGPVTRLLAQGLEGQSFRDFEASPLDYLIASALMLANLLSGGCISPRPIF